MKVIRNKIFETNSSSTHVITIPKKVDDSLKERREKITFNIGDFGWSYEKHDLPDYIWTAICSVYSNEYEEYKQKIINMLTPYYKQIEFEEPHFIESYNEDGILDWKYLDSMQGYVDHAGELKDFLSEIFNDEELFINAILSGYVRTGNDNDDGYELDDLDNNPDYYHYYKGN